MNNAHHAAGTPLDAGAGPGREPTQRPERSEPPPIQVVTLGETMGLLTTAEVGPLRHGSYVRLGMGGAESNVAIALQRLGVRAAWIGCLGRDIVGDLILRELNAEGVATRVRRIAAADTGLMIKERGVGGHTRVWYYRTGSAGSHLQRSDVPEELIRSARVLHVTGITPALSATASDAVTYACQVAREHGVAVSFDVNFRSRLWNRELAATTLTEVVKLADIVFAGLTEVSLFTGADREPIEAARSLARLGPRQVVVKRGTAGACAWADGAAYVQEAIPVSVVDPVGSGDAFAAGYLRELVGGAPVVERLATAARSGAFACTVPGDWEGMPRYEELDLLSSPANVTR